MFSEGWIGNDVPPKLCPVKVSQATQGAINSNLMLRHDIIPGVTQLCMHLQMQDRNRVRNFSTFEEYKGVQAQALSKDTTNKAPVRDLQCISLAGLLARHQLE